MSDGSTQFAQFRRPNALRAAASLIAAVAPSALGVALTLAAAAALALVAWPANAALYKWVDANGRVIYSDQPPNGNFKVEAINAPPPPANPNAAKELAGKEAELQQKKVLRADEETKAAKTKADNEKKREQCARVRGQIAMMQSDQNVVLFRSNEKGEPVYMDDAARRKERGDLEAWVRENCSS
jgi:Skp family chaperone for outer membrane proteins